MEYILLIHSNVTSTASDGQWNEFFSSAKRSGIFAGGSEIRPGELIGCSEATRVSDQIAGHMRFNTGDAADGYKLIKQLLQIHPTVLNGGTVELCEMPRSR